MIVTRTMAGGNHHTREFHCHNNLGRPHQTTEISKREPIAQIDFQDELPSEACTDYRVTIECDLCGKMAVVNRGGFVLERINGF